MLKAEPQVPPLLAQCIAEIQKRGMDEEYLYSQAGKLSDVEALLKKFDRGKSAPDLGKELIVTISSTIKNFLRSLPERLVTVCLYDDFHEAATICNSQGADTALREAVAKLPQANRYILAFLIIHLRTVTEHSGSKMTVRSLGTVFGPTLVSDTKESTPVDQIGVSAFSSFTLIF